MKTNAKICGLGDRAGVEAAARHGAAYFGFVFYPPSPRYVMPRMAAALAELVPTNAKTVAVVVNADDDTIAGIMTAYPFDILQLHGDETPGRVADIARRFRCPVMKAVAVAGPEDIERARAYETVADMLLFDAKAPKSMPDALPGGNGLRFDWELLARNWRGIRPWMLSGGLDADNVAEAIATSGARIVDVSSGVEDRPGVKSPDKIRAFLAAVKNA